MNQIDLENKYASFQQRPRLMDYFMEKIREPEAPDEEETDDNQDEWHTWRQDMKDYVLAIKILAMVVLHRRLPLSGVVSLFKHEPSQRVMDACTVLVRAHWLWWDEARSQLVTCKLPADLEQDVFSRHFPLPMVEPPRLLLEQEDSPFYTEDRRASVLGGWSGQTTDLAALNALNQVPLRLNRKVLDQVPEDPSADPRFRAQQHHVHEVLGDQTFWLTWSPDFRGRLYTSGYHVNLQGTDRERHVLCFA